MIVGAVTTCPPLRVPVLMALLVSPLYSAVMTLVPVVLKVLIQVAEPKEITTAPQPVSVTPPTLMLSVPLGERPVTVAVKVTALPATLGLTLLVTAVVVVN